MAYGDLQFFDIIIFAVIAVFLIYRLRNVLGKRTGYQKTSTTNQYTSPKKPPPKKRGRRRKKTRIREPKVIPRPTACFFNRLRIVFIWGKNYRKS